MNRQVRINFFTHKIFVYVDDIPVRLFRFYSLEQFQESLNLIERFEMFKRPASYDKILVRFKKVFNNVLVCN